MSLQFGPPTDPAYSRFIAGLKKVAADPKLEGARRWHGREQNWYVYDRVKWGFEDVGLADTPPESALRQDWKIPHSTWSVVDFSVPQLFERLQKAFAAYSRSFPKGNLVWSPLDGGDWRNAFERPADRPKPPPPKGNGVTLPEAAVKAIEQVKEYERRGFITHEQAQRMIAAIIAEHT